VTNVDEMAELAPISARSAVDVGAESRGSASGRAAMPGDPASAEHTRLLDALSARSPRTAADLAARSGLSIARVQALLGEIELDGVVRQSERGWMRRP
jgi:DNA processing protein